MTLGRALELAGAVGAWASTGGLAYLVRKHKTLHDRVAGLERVTRDAIHYTEARIRPGPGSWRPGDPG